MPKDAFNSAKSLAKIVKSATKDFDKGKISAQDAAQIAAEARQALADGTASGWSDKDLSKLEKELAKLTKALGTAAPADTAGQDSPPSTDVPDFKNLKAFEKWAKDLEEDIESGALDAEAAFMAAADVALGTDFGELDDKDAKTLKKIADALDDAAKAAKDAAPDLDDNFAALADAFDAAADVLENGAEAGPRSGGLSGSANGLLPPGFEPDPDNNDDLVIPIDNSDGDDKVGPIDEDPGEVAPILTRETLTDDFGPLLKDFTELKTFSDALDWLQDASNLSDHRDLDILTRDLPGWIETFPTQDWNGDFLTFLGVAGQGADGILDMIADILREVDKSDIKELEKELAAFGDAGDGPSTRAATAIAPLPDPDMNEFLRLARRFPDNASQLLQQNATPLGMTEEGYRRAAEALQEVERDAAQAQAAGGPALAAPLITCAWIVKMLAVGLSVIAVVTVLAVTLTDGEVGSGAGDGPGDGGGDGDDSGPDIPDDFDIIDERNVTEDWSEFGFDIDSTIEDSTNITVEYGGGDDTVIVRDSNKVEILANAGDDYLWLLNSDGLAIDAGAGDDTVIVQGGSIDQIDSGKGDDAIILVGIDDAVVDAGDGKDTVDIAGGDGFEVDLGKGDDTFYATAASGEVKGGAGADTFVFNDLDAIAVRILDFEIGKDKIALSRSEYNMLEDRWSVLDIQQGDVSGLAWLAFEKGVVLDKIDLQDLDQAAFDDIFVVI